MSLEQFQSLIDDAQAILFFGGAGVSTESGIPDFRSVDGLYQQKYPFPPETILSHSFFTQHPDIFYQFYKEKMIYLDAKPNVTHITLAQLEAKGKLRGIVTQNIDGLHQMANSQRVYELHGSIHRNYCMQCKAFHPLESIIHAPDIPRCNCGGIIKPDVTLYEESLNEQTMADAIEAISQADLLIIGGTSLKVYPAANFIHYFQGKHLVVINKEELNLNQSTLFFNQALGSLFSQIKI